MYLIWILCFLNGIICDKLDNGHCDKEEGCNSESSGKPIIFTKGKEDKDGQKSYPPINDKYYLIKDTDQPKVLWWHDHIYPHASTLKELTCSLGKCGISSDRKTLKDELTRGIIFYGTSFENDDLPLPRLPHHEWALFHEESPKNNWMLSTVLGISIFNHTATFRRESDYPLSTQFMRNIDGWFDDKYFVSTEEKNRLQKEEGLAPLVYVQGDCNPPSDRDTYVKELMKYIKVDSYGRCLHNKEMPENIKGFHLLSSKKYYSFMAKYKFQIAIENALCEDYMTEKIFRPLEIGSVPVYLGSNKILDFMPSKKSVILISDFTSPKELAMYINELNNNDIKYNEYIEHRKTGITNEEFHKSIARQPWKIQKWETPNFGHFMFARYSCHVCDQLHKRNNHLKSHLEDNNISPLPIRFGKHNHLGCPVVNPSYIGGNYPHDDSYIREAKALINMFLANETDSKNWEKYLN